MNHSSGCCLTARCKKRVSSSTASNRCSSCSNIEIEGTAGGGIGVHPGHDVYRHTATVGYWLGEQFWGRGIMTEAVTAVTYFCFDYFPLRRISAEVFANNPASARVLEKAGFTFEGRLKNNVMKDGQVLDSLLYARTK